MIFDKEGSKFEKKKCLCVCVEGRGARCTDIKTVSKTVFFFFNIYIYIYFFFNFLIFFLLFKFFLIFFKFF